ncbi:MAG TPA: hypothetical protein VFU49_02525 [Ktedonobacteraceae bacterium]|nr:hypothetical protein [Ktedonobacteraceae bacterium]
MSDSSFENIAQEILQQKRLMETLEAENKELRRQLADLREARGIFLEIDGNRFAFSTGEVQATLQASQPISDSSPMKASSPSHTLTPSEPHKTLHSTRMIADAPTTTMAKIQIPRQEIQDVITNEDEDERANLPPLVEQAIQEELAPGKAAPIGARARSFRRAELTTEEQQAALRRELTGSFLLE